MMKSPQLDVPYVVAYPALYFILQHISVVS